MIPLTILIFSVVAILILGLTIYIKNSNSLTNRLFALLAIGLSGWSIVSYLSLNVETGQLFLIRLTMLFVVLVNSVFLFLAQAFPRAKITFTPRLKRLALYCLFTLLVTISPLLFTDIVHDSSGNISPVPGPGMIFFLAHAILCFVGGPIYLARRYFHSKGLDRLQLRFILAGMLLLFTLLPLTNFIFPVVFSNSTFINYSPIYGFVFSSFIAYAIVKHHLFDIKRAVARSVAYLLALGFIGLIYGLVIFLLSSVFIADNKIDSTERASYIGLALLSALLYPPTKKFFDKLTNRIFYRDAYDPEVFLDELNAAIVGNIELGVLLRHTTAIIQKNLKCEHCFVEILPNPGTHRRVIGVGSISLDREESEYIMHRLDSLRKKIVVTDNLGSGESKFRNLLSSKDVGIIVSLTPNNVKSGDTIARLIIGEKKSGNVYDKQDLHTIDIISDELLIAIENALRFEEIQGFAAKLQAEVNTATAKLQRTNKKLRELDETKDEFISMASHQLRTPLTSVKGYMSMVLEGDAGKITKQQRELLNQAFVSSQRMVYLIADLLNVSRLKTGKFVIESNSTNLAEVIGGEIDQLRETAKSKKIDIAYEKPENFPTLMLDETKIRQVIMNFVDNAVYYTPIGGKVKVHLSEDKSNIYFKVTDNGLGVPKSDIPHLFTKFYRASNAKKARPDGTGLGLFMAKKIIDAQGGNILFESEENKGSMFGFCFNKKKHLPKHSKGSA